MSDIHLEDMERQARNDPLLLARAHAIQAYAMFETNLCMLFAALLGTDMKLAGIVFFRINNARARNAIIESLLEQRHQKDLAVYWDSLLKMIRSMDHRRNEIIHWHTMMNIHFEGDKATPSLALVPPNVWGRKVDSPQLTAPNLLQFCAICDFVARSILFLMLFTSGQLNATEQQTWREIFREPAVYPPPSTHPLSLKPAAPQTPPPPSQG